MANGYIKGQLKLTRSEDGQTYTLTGPIFPFGDTDHMQLIYEALEIAAHSTDPFATSFAAMRDEWLETTADWSD